MPIEKKKDDTVYQGTKIERGYAKIKIETTGEKTKFGEISTYVTQTKSPPTPLQKQLHKLAQIISVIVLISSIALFIYGILQDYEVYDMLTTAVAVAVASVPEGLVIALTVILAVGMRSILKKNAVVKKMVAAETLGSVTTICIDKTGTITKGDLKVELSELTDTIAAKKIITFANNRLDLLDNAVLSWAEREASLPEINKQNFKKIDFLPFNSANKFTATLVRQKEEKQELLVYGAAEVLLNSSTADPEEKSEWQDKIDAMSDTGAKVIGYAYKTIPKNNESPDLTNIQGVTFVGIQGLSDPIRPEIRDTLHKISNAGIKLKLVTGDHLVTALNIAKKAGLVSKSTNAESPNVISGKKLSQMSDNELKQAVFDTTIFARVSPKDKYRIVEALRSQGEVVAMTGDGVNDAPALKNAAIGVVVNEASDVSKDVADIVLLDSNLETIVHSIEEGRRIFANIRKVILYLFSDSLTELVLIISSLFLKLPLAITAGQILWINLIEDSFPALSLAMEPPENDVMKSRPRKNTLRILDKDMIKIMISFIIITNITLVGTYLFLVHQNFDITLIRTLIFANAGFDSIVYIFSCKSLRKPIFKYNILSNKYLLGSVGFGLMMLAASIYIPVLNTLLKTVPLDLHYWPYIIGFGLFNLVIIELLKLLTMRQRVNSD